jgi:hypothetical protein
MPAPRVIIGEPFHEVFGLLERIVRQLGYEPVRIRPAMRIAPPEADVVVLEESFELGRELLAVLRRRNPGLPVVYLKKPFRIDDLRRALEQALASPREKQGRLLVSVSVR